MESSNAFELSGTAEKTAAALGRILMLDLVIRNEDRLPCRQLGWRGNQANLLSAEKLGSADVDAFDEAFDTAIKQYRPRMIKALQKDRRSTSVDGKLSPRNAGLVSQGSDLSDISETSKFSETSISHTSGELSGAVFQIVAIDSGVPRRPPAGKRSNDQANYPKVVELLLNSPEFACHLVHDITGGKLGYPPNKDGDTIDIRSSEIYPVLREFRSGFRAALRDLQGIHIFLLTLHQKLDNLLRGFLNIIDKTTSGDIDREDLLVPESPSQHGGGGICPSPPSKERALSDNHQDFDTDLQRTAPRSLSKESSDSNSPMSRESWLGKFQRSNTESSRSLRLTTKLRDFHKFAKVILQTEFHLIIYFKSVG